MMLLVRRRWLQLVLHMWWVLHKSQEQPLSQQQGQHMSLVLVLHMWWVLHKSQEQPQSQRQGQRKSQELVLHMTWWVLRRS